VTPDEPREERPEELEELLWQTASAAGDDPGDGGEALRDDLLRAYREGDLPPRERRRVEERLAASAAARARLAELGGVSAVAPEAVRRRVLAARPGAAGGGRRWRPAADLRFAAALAAGLAVAAVALWLARAPGPAPPIPEDAYEVTVQGLAGFRSAPGPGNGAPGGPVEALPETRVTLRVEPRGAPDPAVELALYRRLGERLLRVPEAAPVEVVEGRGAAAFSAPAAALVGPEPGLRTVFVVAGRRGELPAELALERAGDGEAASLLAAGGTRFVRPVRLRVLPAPPVTVPEG